MPLFVYELGLLAVLVVGSVLHCWSLVNHGR